MYDTQIIQEMKLILKRALCSITQGRMAHKVGTSNHLNPTLKSSAAVDVRDYGMNNHNYNVY